MSMTARSDVEKILDPEDFGLPDVARAVLAGRDSGHPFPEVGIEELQATLCDFVVAFREALLELADRVDGQH